MSLILREVKNIIKNIKENGISINGTKEVQNVLSSFNISDMNIAEEESEIVQYYNIYVEDYEARKALEKTHYDRLEAALIHELTRTQWFSNFDKKQAVLKFADENALPSTLAKSFNKSFDLLDFSGRRNVIHSLDCISSIQLLCRPEKNVMSVTIRSSDTVRLLPIDILFTIKLLKKVLAFHNIPETKNDNVTILIVSSHFYDKDAEIVDKLI